MKCMKANKNNLKPHGNDIMKKEHTTIDKAQSEFKNAQIFVSKKAVKRLKEVLLIYLRFYKVKFFIPFTYRYLKKILSIGKNLNGQVLVIDLLNLNFRKIKFKKLKDVKKKI